MGLSMTGRLCLSFRILRHLLQKRQGSMWQENIAVDIWKEIGECQNYGGIFKKLKLDLES